MTTNPPWVAHYEKGVSAAIDIPAVSVHQLLTKSASQYADHVAVRLVLKYLKFGLMVQSKLTYGELENAANRFAAVLYALGVRKGDRVALMLPNLPQLVIAYFGTLKAGGIVVNTNPTYTARELGHQLHDSGAETIVMLSSLYDRLTRIREQTAVKHVILTDVSDSLGWPFKGIVEKQLRASGMLAEVSPAPDIHWFYPLLRQHMPQAPQVESSNDDVILFQYSGGTTGIPKAAMLTNGNLISNVYQMDAWFAQIRYGKEKILGALPFFHVYGMTVGMLLAISSAAELVVVPDPRNSDHILDVIQRERITIYPGVPAMYTAIINHPKAKEYDLRSISACVSGGASLPIEVSDQFEEITGGKLVEGYGLSEASPIVAANPIHGDRKVGSIGLPIPNTRITVVSLEPDNQGIYTELKTGEEGELVVYGPQVMKGYWNRPDETAKTIDSTGGLHTGDIAKMDADGYFYIVDRKKDLIIASGYNIVPREVEEVLFMHPKVMEAAVAGVPDAKRGETVKAFIVLKAGETATIDEIRSFCKQNLAPYKVPTLVEFRNELPKSQVGKVLRRLLVQEEKEQDTKPAAVVEG